MKTGILLTLGAVALTAITFNANANDVALSPRAAANRIQTVPTVANDTNPALACRKMMTASPKAIAACEANSAMPGCSTVAAASAK